jgi:hypothetical protein
MRHNAVIGGILLIVGGVSGLPILFLPYWTDYGGHERLLDAARLSDGHGANIVYSASWWAPMVALAAVGIGLLAYPGLRRLLGAVGLALALPIVLSYAGLIVAPHLGSWDATYVQIGAYLGLLASCAAAAGGLMALVPAAEASTGAWAAEPASSIWGHRPPAPTPGGEA